MVCSTLEPTSVLILYLHNEKMCHYFVRTDNI